MKFAAAISCRSKANPCRFFSKNSLIFLVFHFTWALKRIMLMHFASPKIFKALFFMNLLFLL
jgi:hypothetical protein